jgi:4-methyl-5(b-hydroxyethyl)-thiazole monophosphate biosynthesis
VLGKRGYLQNKKAVCYPGFESYLTGAVKPCDGTRVCTDGKIITGAGAGVATDFALALIPALHGNEKADEICRAILAD